MKSMEPLTPAATLSERAADVLRSHILGGHLASGERVVEARIARELGISRGPVREALKQLRAEGLVRDEPRRGSFVVKLNADDVAEIYELRAAIETRAVRVLATERNPAALQRLHDAIAAIEYATANGDGRDVARADIAFHGEACRLLNNVRLYRVFTTHAELLQSLLVLENEAYYDDLHEIVDEHRVLLALIESGDPTRAVAEWDRHLERTKQRLMALMAEGQPTA
jgi:GntR family transcriptional regulator of gluconate operon